MFFRPALTPTRPLDEFVEWCTVRDGAFLISVFRLVARVITFSGSFVINIDSLNRFVQTAVQFHDATEYADGAKPRYFMC